MSLLGWAVAGGIQGAGRGAAEVLKTKRMLKGEKLRHDYLMTRQKAQQEFQRELSGEERASREKLAGQATESREGIASRATESRERLAGQATESRELIAGEAMESRERMSGEGMESRETIARERTKLLKEEGEKNRQLRRDLAKADALKGGKGQLKERDELENRKYLSKRLGLDRLLEQRGEFAGEDNEEEANKSLEDEILEMHNKIDHIMTLRNETGKWPWETRVTRSDVEEWSRESGKSYEETVLEFLGLAYRVGTSDRRSRKHSPMLAPSH